MLKRLNYIIINKLEDTVDKITKYKDKDKVKGQVKESRTYTVFHILKILFTIRNTS